MFKLFENNSAIFAVLNVVFIEFADFFFFFLDQIEYYFWSQYWKETFILEKVIVVL
jgi:hypothetical protein